MPDNKENIKNKSSVCSSVAFITRGLMQNCIGERRPMKTGAGGRGSPRFSSVCIGAAKMLRLVLEMT
jgi:hypothetical protein